MAQDYSFTITAVDNATSVIDKINSELDSLQNKAKNIDIGANGNAVKSQINALSQSKQQTSKALKNLTTGAAKTSSQIISGATTAGKQVTSGITSGIKNAVKNTQSASAKAGSAIGKNIATASKSAASSNVSRTIRDWNKVAENATSKTPSVNVDKLFRGDAQNAQKEWSDVTKKYAKAIVDSASNPQAQAQFKQQWNSLRTQRNANFSDRYSKEFSNIQRAADKAIGDVQEKGLSTYKALDPTNLQGTLSNLGKTLGDQKTWGGNIPEQISSQMRDARTQVEGYMDTAKSLGSLNKTLESSYSSFGKTLDSVQMKGRSFREGLDPSGLMKDYEDYGYRLRNKDAFGTGEMQSARKELASLQERAEEFSKPENIMMDSTSIAKYAQKMSRALNGQMSGKTRKVGEGYMSQLQDYLEGNSKVDFKSWKTQNIPGMESFMARASKENNGATGFFKRFSASLGAQNASFLAQYFSTQDLINYGKQMANNSKAVDSAMIELRKVSNQTPAELKTSQNTAFRMAQQYGARGTDVINSMADWSRLNITGLVKRSINGETLEIGNPVGNSGVLSCPVTITVQKVMIEHTGGGE